MITISVSNLKGGCSKSTTASSLAAGLVQRGFRVLTIDLDAQANITTTAGINPNIQAEKTVKGLMAGTPLNEIVVKTPLGDTVPSCLEVLDADKVFTSINAIRLIKKAVMPYADNYDFCILDTPPHPGIMTVNGLCFSDYVIIPVNAAFFSMAGVDFLRRVMNEVREVENPNLKVLGILLTRYNPRTKFGREAAESFAKMANRMGTTLFDSTIRQAVVVEETQANGIDIMNGAKGTKVADDYSKFIDEVLARLGIDNKEEKV